MINEISSQKCPQMPKCLFSVTNYSTANNDFIKNNQISSIYSNIDDICQALTEKK